MLSVAASHEELRINPKKFVHHSFGYRGYIIINFANIPFLFRHLRQALGDNLAHIKLRMADFDHDHSKPGTSRELCPNKVMDLRGISKLLHQAKKSIGCFVPRKHCFINQRQGSGTGIQEIANLTGVVLKSDNLSGPFWSSPEQTAMVKGEIDEQVGPRVYPIIFSSNIEKGTYLTIA